MKQQYHRPAAFTRTNLYLLLASLLLIIIGYILMSGGKSADGVTFNPEVFSPLRIKVAPMLCTLGYGGVLAAILWRGKARNKNPEA